MVSDSKIFQFSKCRFSLPEKENKLAFFNNNIYFHNSVNNILYTFDGFLNKIKRIPFSVPDKNIEDRPTRGKYY